MPPAIIGGAIAAAGAVGSAAIASKGASNAAKATQQAADQSAAVQREVYGQNKETLAPYVNAGLPATANINALLGLSSDPAQTQKAFDQYRNSTGYNFRFNEGMRALNAGYAGAGTLQSGDAIKSALKYGQGIGSAEFGNYLGALGNQQALGMSAASATAGVGQNYANSLGNIYQAQGDNLANAALLKAQNTGQAINSLANIGGSILGRSNFGGSSLSPVNYNALSNAAATVKIPGFN